MRKAARLALAIALAVTMAGLLALWGFYRAARHVPRFYQKALATQPAAQEAAGEAFERQALALHNQLRRPGRWEARFKQDEINGWLAADLPMKFPQALPHGLSEPRVAIEAGKAYLAARYETGDAVTVISWAGEVYLTDETNEVAVRIDHVRAGALPVPMARLMDEIATGAARAGFPLRWTEFDGVPVALIKVPPAPQGLGNRQLELEAVELRDGELIVAGRTAERTLASAAPQPSDQPSQAAAQPADSETRQR